ncbi:hypothetical protein [Saccharicrinis aurantiacus]|uniref:hypothetical protein n=1 Tax=Saccharicrinis aurantiacus TaxID=1849719 RepID=UPI002490461F|nr:hypothetical protein [Saccharicrinis aurantiacus]
MRKLLTTLCLNVIIINQLLACGGGWSESYYCYHLFDQKLMADESYFPFLEKDSYASWGYQYANSPIKANVKLWQQSLDTWSVADIHTALTTDTSAVFEGLWKNKNSAYEQKAYTYMSLARECSEAYKSRSYNPWRYRADDEAPQTDFSELSERTMLLYSQETDATLKLRYAYQVIRNFHYAKQYNEAVVFFNDKVRDNSKKNEIYYYILDQVAGCYYSLEQFEQAAYYFIQVFNNSVDRRTSAYSSYRFCTRNGSEGKSLFITPDDEAAYITLKAIQSYSSDYEYLDEMLKADAQNKKLELLFVRSIYQLERNSYKRKIGLKSETLLYRNDEESRPDLEKLLSISDQMLQLSANNRKDFWNLCTSYLQFINGNISVANAQLAKVSAASEYAQQVSELKQIYTVLAWDKMDATHETYLKGIAGDKLHGGELLSFIKEYIGHLYYKQGDIAKSFLVHNRLDNLKDISSIDLLNNMDDFLQKSDKTPFEKLLLKNASSKPDIESQLAEVRHFKGLYYLNHGDPVQAKAHFDAKSTQGIISAKVFSNNIKECFYCDDDLMEDEVYKASCFSFIEPEFTFYDLSDNLIKLDSLTHDPAIWKQKLAYYLLGNYYFNVSNTGYYRGLQKQYRNAYYNNGIKNSKDLDLSSPNKVGYNLDGFSFGSNKRIYYALADTAYNYYNKVIDLSTDKELNARCSYLMAKCELNHLYNNNQSRSYGYGYYDGALNNETSDYKKGFKRLKDDYADTQFYGRIIKECSFFNYYTTQ